MASRTRKLRPPPSVRKVKEDDVRSEVASVLDGLVYITESVAKLEGVPKRRTQSKGPRAKSKGTRAQSVNSVAQKRIQLNSGPKNGTTNGTTNGTKNGTTNGTKNGTKNFTNKIKKLSVRRSRARKSESEVIKQGINI